MKYVVQGQITVSCWTEVEAPTIAEALRIAESRELAAVLIDGGYPVDECWHIDSDGTPGDLHAFREGDV